MKFDRMRPIFKKNSPLDVSNLYRFVSILSIVSNILERSIYIQSKIYRMHAFHDTHIPYNIIAIVCHWTKLILNCSADSKVNMYNHSTVKQSKFQRARVSTKAEKRVQLLNERSS